MSLFEIGNYVIIDDLYMGRIIKKIWNGYGMIVKLDNEPNYVDDTILQYHLLNDVVDNSDIKGFMLVKSNNKMRLVNKNNLANLIKNELNQEKFIYIENKINRNFAYFKSEILPNIQTNIMMSMPIVPVAINHIPVQPSSEIVGGGLEINKQLKKINKYVKNNDLIKNTLPEKQLLTNLDDEMKNTLGTIYNPYGITQKIIFNRTNIPKLINTFSQYGASNPDSLVKVDKLLHPTQNIDLSKTDSISRIQGINSASSKEQAINPTSYITPAINSTNGIPQVINSMGDITHGNNPTNNVDKNILKYDKQEIKNINQEDENQEDKDKIEKYREQDKAEDNYELYIRNMIANLFKSEYEVDHEEFFEIGKLTASMAENLNIIADGERVNKIKPTIKLVLEKFKKINKSMYLDLTNTLLYKHIIADNKLDNVSFGKELIIRIKECLLKIQEKIKFEDNRPTEEIINLFQYLKFKIAGGYILIEDITKESMNIRTITAELVPELKLLNEQYGNPINYQILSNIILENKSTLDVKKNKEIITEALNILAQEYFICMQPRVEYLLWCLTRLILCWYSDPVLNENIVKIKVLINLYRARGIKDFNKDVGVQPVIMIVPKYGRESALKILSNLSYYFFPYKNVGWKGSSPSYFNKVDDLIYYTNGSIDLKRYIKHLIKTGNELVSPISNDFTKIKLPNETNDIEYKLPK